MQSGRAVWFQNENGTAALVLGWLTAWLAFLTQLGVFYACAAVLLGAAAWRRLWLQSDDAAGAVFLPKALGALTLAVIKLTSPEWTALVLIVQVGVMVETNRRLHSAVIAAGSGILATVALCFWRKETVAHPSAAGSLVALGRGLTLAGFLAWGMELARDCGISLADEARRSIARVVSGAAAVMALLLS